MYARNGTKDYPFESAQVVLADNSGRLFFHRNTSIVQGDTKLTLFGGKVEEDDKNAFSRVITEVREEAGVLLLPSNLRKITEDGPKEYEKGWFLAHIYFSLVTAEAGELFVQHQDTETFNSKILFEASRDLNWKNFDSTKILVDKALKIGKF